MRQPGAGGRPAADQAPSEPPLPNRSADDTDLGWSEPVPDDAGEDERRLLDERPPHHDR